MPNEIENILISTIILALRKDANLNEVIQRIRVPKHLPDRFFYFKALKPDEYQEFKLDHSKLMIKIDVDPDTFYELNLECILDDYLILMNTIYFDDFELDYGAGNYSEESQAYFKIKTKIENYEGTDLILIFYEDRFNKEIQGDVFIYDIEQIQYPYKILKEIKIEDLLFLNSVIKAPRSSKNVISFSEILKIYNFFLIIDISDPTNPGTPFLEGRDDGTAHGVFVKDDYAYMVPGEVGLVIIHVRELFSPIITETPSDLIVDFGYAGKNVSWTATDRDAGNYTVELLGTGVVAGPTAWTNGTEVIFNISDGLLPGDSIFRITFTDIYDNSVSDSVTMTVRDTMNPEITITPPDFSAAFGYTEANISWTATDHTPNTYTITLEGTGVVAGPTAWSSGTVVRHGSHL